MITKQPTECVINNIWVDDGISGHPFLNGDGKTGVLIQPETAYDQHFEIDNEEFNQLFDEEMECMWTTELSLNAALFFLKSIGMKNNSI